MHYLPGILLALVLALIAYLAVIAGINLTLSGLGDQSRRFPVLPRFSVAETVARTGIDFEQFVVDRFDPGHFRLVKWLKKDDAISSAPEDETGPDLEYEALVHRQVIPFAVECKWRPGFSHGNIDFSICNSFSGYRQFSAEKGIPVFLIIGVGGTQTQPNDCYVIPMDVILPHFTYLSKKFLDHYRRQQPDSVLFLDTNQMTLR